ncbi:monofunctional biosynthetic peptidoglycan transglycosylase [Roseovarius faecimaris]|uniref:Biosynthetic peptidoglycan transglycosylase n=1 Tax=Roseovarius faecimaris TaxID=2494550 RepID=A0A6I6J5M5_9RHOB|nr:monofunctional biosynthetic peptidoglycan transglycosylase [Roseovarius faecimaris]QGY00069.1 monofunctional biosynthetic peptidoglycan transglycosylase [Roseovarius faecimaris]
MARKAAKRSSGKTDKSAPRRGLFSSLRRWIWRLFLIVTVLVVLLVVIFSQISPPRTFYMGQEARRLGAIDYQWVPMSAVAPVMARSVVAAEDANFCRHWGFDMDAIRAALEEGSGRGASTISQQVVKNVFLWHGRSWARKALEAAITPLVELVWSKRRIVEVYLNVAEFDEGVFGIDAAAYHYFGVGPGELSPTQAARLAMVLPNPKGRSASKPTAQQRKRAAQILDGAATIRRDGRAACFED